METNSVVPGSATGFAWDPSWGNCLVLVLGILAVTRLGTFVPLPGLDLAMIANLPIHQSGAWARLGLFALGLTPFVTAWVIMEVFRGNRSEADVGRTRRWLTALLAAFQGWGIANGLEAVRGLVPEPGMLFRLTTVLSLTAGTMLLVWLGDRITKTGFCDGVWLIVASSTIAELPSTLAMALEIQRLGQPQYGPPILAAPVVLVVLLVALVVVVQLARRHVSAAEVVPGSSSSDQVALKLDHVTVLPSYLAAFVLMLPWLAMAFVGLASDSSGHWLSSPEIKSLFDLALHAVLIVLATFMATAAVVSPRRLAGQLVGKDQGSALVHANRGLDAILTRLTATVAAYMLAVLLLPKLITGWIGLPFAAGGASLVIVVIVMLDILSRASVPVQRSE